MDCSTPGFPVLTVSQSLLRFMPIESVMLSNISFSAASFFFCLQSFPALRSFPISPLFLLGGQSIGASASVLPMNIQGTFPLGLTDLISLQSKVLSRSAPEPQFESINFLMLSLLYSPTLTFVHDYWKTIALTVRTFVSKVMSLHGDVGPTQIQSLTGNI